MRNESVFSRSTVQSKFCGVASDTIVVMKIETKIADMLPESCASMSPRETVLTTPVMVGFAVQSLASEVILFWMHSAKAETTGLAFLHVSMSAALMPPQLGFLIA